MKTISRQTIKTIGIWTLQRREFENNDHDYVITSDGKPAVSLYVNDRPDFKAGRIVYTVEYYANSRQMDLEDAANYVAQAQYALVAATEFQKAIDSAENN